MNAVVQPVDFNDILIRLQQALMQQHATLATAESCSGGLLAFLLTALPGSSDYFFGSVVAYSNECKVKLLDVPRKLIETHGAVSKEVALAMAEGAKVRLGVNYSVSVTGIAGPGGASTGKPVGTIWLGFASETNTESYKLTLSGDRHAIRIQTAHEALKRLGCFIGG